MKRQFRYGKKADLALDTWVKLARASAVFGKESAAQIRTFGLTEAQFAALECLGHKGPMTLGELCRKQLVTGGNMTVVVDHLEREELVERRRLAADRRSYTVSLTSKGTRLFKRIFPDHAAHIAGLASVLTEEEQLRLGDLLKKLGRGLQAMSPTPRAESASEHVSPVARRRSRIRQLTRP